MLVVAFKFIVFALLMIVCAMLLLLVLMQRPKQEGLGAAFGAHMTDQAFGARTTDVLKKGTIFFGSLFMILCFLLSVLIQNEHSTEKMKNETPVKTQATPVEQKTETAATEQKEESKAEDQKQEEKTEDQKQDAPEEPAAPAEDKKEENSAQQ